MEQRKRRYILNTLFIVIGALFTSVWGFSSTAYDPKRSFSASQVPEELKGLEIEEKTGSSIDLHLKFTDEQGNKVALKGFFENNRPILLSVIYYGCPNLCGLHLNGLSEALKGLPMEFKNSFNFVLVSMDHTETPELALKKKQSYITKYSLPSERTHFLVGEKKSIASLSEQVGFKFRWDDNQKIYAHLPVAYILTPAGRISRYLYGVTFQTQTLRLSLVEASQGKIGSIVDRILLFCFQFDPKSRRYSWYAYNIMRAGGALTLFLLLFFLLPVWIRENKKLKKRES